MMHFSAPSASDGKLFLATGASVEAFTIANPASSASPAPGAQPPPPPIVIPTCGCRGKLCQLRLALSVPRTPGSRPPRFTSMAGGSGAARPSSRGAVVPVSGSPPNVHGPSGGDHQHRTPARPNRALRKLPEAHPPIRSSELERHLRALTAT
jgi:hypothetical protein